MWGGRADQARRWPHTHADAVRDAPAPLAGTRGARASRLLLNHQIIFPIKRVCGRVVGRGEA